MPGSQGEDSMVNTLNTGEAGRYIDTAEFTRLGTELSGRTSLEAFSRFGEGLPQQPDGWVTWSLQGARDSGGQSFLLVTLKAQPVLQCQRCLEPFTFDVNVSNRVQVVTRESDLDDDEGDDDAPERVLGGRRFDVLSFIEDELILAVPYVPRHEICPSAVAVPAAPEPVPEDTRPSPFAVLEQLKQKH